MKKTQGESQRDPATGKLQDQVKGLTRELGVFLIVIATFEIVIPAYKTPSELANTDHLDVKRQVSFISMVSGLIYLSLPGIYLEGLGSTSDSFISKLAGIKSCYNRTGQREVSVKHSN